MGPEGVLEELRALVERAEPIDEVEVDPAFHLVVRRLVDALEGDLLVVALAEGRRPLEAGATLALTHLFAGRRLRRAGDTLAPTLRGLREALSGRSLEGGEPIARSLGERRAVRARVGQDDPVARLAAAAGLSASVEAVVAPLVAGRASYGVLVLLGGGEAALGPTGMSRLEEAGRLCGRLLERVADPRAPIPLRPQEDEGPTADLVGELLEEALASGASDLHVDPVEDGVRVRCRIDGVLVERPRLARVTLEPLLRRFKVMAPPMKIDETRLPQDGRLRYRTRAGEEVDLRIATGPSILGERLVVRLVASGGPTLGLADLDLAPQNLERVRWAIGQPHGLIVCCGPTGSGKTTTLFAALAELASPRRAIVTAEDPVELRLPGAVQTQVNEAIGFTFARALRSFMRMDPDVILVGEIRDRETAACAIDASLTGHLLLSTLHTNDAPGTVTRLLELGIEPFLLTSSLLLVVAQRLVRRLCPACREPWSPTLAEREEIGASSGEVLFRARPTGCPACHADGYRGRVGVHELLAARGPLAPVLRDAIASRVSADSLRAASVRLGARTLWQDALQKVRQGTTDLAEVVAVVRRDDLA